MRHTLLLTLCSLFSLNLSAQNGFVKTFGEPGENQDFPSLAILPNGNIAIAGSSDNKATISLLDPEGAPIWTKKYSFGTSPTYFSNVAPANDDNIVVVFYAQVNTNTSISGVCKINQNGGLLWCTSIRHNIVQPFLFKIISAKNGGYLAMGYTDSHPTLGRYYDIVQKLDEDGNLVWSNSQVYQGNFTSVAEHPSGDVYAVGNFVNGWESTISKYSPSGTLIWNRHLSGDNLDRPNLWSVLTLPNDRLLVAGYMDSALTIRNLLIASTDADGNFLWGKTYDLAGQTSLITKLIRLADGNVLAVCGDYADANGNQVVLLKISPTDGTLIWAKQFDAFGKSDFLYDIAPKSDGGYVAVGKTRNTVNRLDLLFLSLDQHFSAGVCCPPDISVEAKNYPMQSVNYPVDPDNQQFSTESVPLASSDFTYVETQFCQPVQLDFTLSDSIICPSECVRFELSGPTAGVNYDWDFGGGVPNPQNPDEICFFNIGQFAVTLIATKELCEEYRQTQPLKVRSLNDAFPNAFTPNGDGINDTYKPLFFCPVITTNFKIYSRWGEKVFETQDPADAWDGKINGKEAPSDVYVWQVEYEAYRDGQQQLIMEKGSVALLR